MVHLRRPDANSRLSERSGPRTQTPSVCCCEGKEDALAFVNLLYEAGAVKVVVDAIMDDKLELDQGDPYADALIVRLPADPGKRLRLVSIAGSESLRRGEPVADVGLETRYFWWD